jgi:hypothetical protein
LGPARTSDTSHIANKLDVVFLQKLEEIGEGVPAMAYGVDRYIVFQNRRKYSERLLGFVGAATFWVETVDRDRNRTAEDTGLYAYRSSVL